MESQSILLKARPGALPILFLPFADDNVNDDGANEGLFFAEPMDLEHLVLCVFMCLLKVAIIH